MLKVGDLVVHVPYGHETVHLLYEALGHSSDFDVGVVLQKKMDFYQVHSPGRHSTGWYQYGEIEKIRE